jgi:hypothetical protein
MSEYITDASDDAVLGFFLESGDELTLRLYSPAGCAECYLSACRADFMESSPAGETEAQALLHGQGLLDADAVEARVGGGVWQGISGWGDALDVGAIAAGNYEDIEIRVTLGAGTIPFGLAIRALPL